MLLPTNKSWTFWSFQRLLACVEHTTYECKVECKGVVSYKIIEWNYYNYMKTTIL
jgi:hypothetical protein